VIDVEALGRDIDATIIGHAANSARSKQKALGASDISKQCERAIGYKLLRVAPVNMNLDPMARIRGSQMHKFMEGAYNAKNKALGFKRYHLEKRTKFGLGLGGKADCYDSVDKALIDWKFVGETGMKRGAKGEDIAYVEQQGLYAKGKIAEGNEVDWLITVYFHMSFGLRKKNIVVVAYDPAIAQRPLDRYAKVKKAIKKDGIEALPLLPTTPKFCDYCDYFMPGATDAREACNAALFPTPTQPITTETRDE
jgi:hypothetical protein